MFPESLILELLLIPWNIRQHPVREWYQCRPVKELNGTPSHLLLSLRHVEEINGLNRHCLQPTAEETHLRLFLHSGQQIEPNKNMIRGTTLRTSQRDKPMFNLLNFIDFSVKTKRNCYKHTKQKFLGPRTPVISLMHQRAPAVC